MTFPADYVERVYAGVLGKLIGVYLGRPFEGWSYDRIMAELGEVHYYVHEQLGAPLVVTDDDVTGTFTFLRALPDYNFNQDVTPAQIGQTWLNYLIEERTILWWGGMGNSTEHTAYLRLKNGISAPESGSLVRNSKVVAEQIGAQIFIDGWAMVAPGDPELAADFARRAGSVSHDGEAIYGAQVLAAMEAQAFVENDINTLIDIGISFIPKSSVIYQMIAEIREWHAKEPDWRIARRWLDQGYGYDKYGGNCHMVPNHGLIIHALLYGDDDFQKSQMIVNTSGWDTDCNAGNLGCLLGIKNGLATINAGPDWRGPVADKLYLPTADGGSSISDAVRVTYDVVNIGRHLKGMEPLAPKGGARFHFELPGSVQGFELEDSVRARGTATIENVVGHSELGNRSLAIHCQGLATGRSAPIQTATFIPSKELGDIFLRTSYELIASPTLYNGQTVMARVSADADNPQPLTIHLFVKSYGADDELQQHNGQSSRLAAGESELLTWQLTDFTTVPIAFVGLEISGASGASGTIYLDYLTWSGEADLRLRKPAYAGNMWSKAWANGVDILWAGRPESFRVIQNSGTGLLMHGTRDWQDYAVSATVTPHMMKAGGLGARVQGMRRYYALLLAPDGKLQLVKALDGLSVLAETDVDWRWRGSYNLKLSVVGSELTGWLDDQPLLQCTDTANVLQSGGIALICEEGRLATDEVAVEPVP